MNNFYFTSNCSSKINSKLIITHNHYYLFFLIITNFIKIIIFDTFNSIFIIIQNLHNLFLIYSLIYKHDHIFIKFIENNVLVP